MEPSSAHCCQKRDAENFDFTWATQPACSAELATMCSAATWNIGIGDVSTLSAVWPWLSVQPADAR